MSDAAKVQQRFEDASRDFLHALLAGRTVVAGAPLTPGMLEAFALSRAGDTDVDNGIFAALHAGASVVAPVRALPWPDRGLAATWMACHNLVAVTDPSLDSWLGRRARAKVLEWTDWLLEQAGAPTSRGAALARHVVVSRTLDLRRTDVEVKNWAYTYRFFGRPVPPRVLAAPRLRLVRKRSWQSSLVELWRSQRGVAPWPHVEKLLARSPVTQMLRCAVCPDLPLGASVMAVLSDDLVRSGIARGLVRDLRTITEPLGRALSYVATHGAVPAFLYYLIALIYEIHVIDVLDRPSGPSAFGAPRSEHEALFLAVLPAIVGAPDDLRALLDLDPPDMVRVRRRAAKLDAMAGPDACRRLVAWLDRATPPPLDHERETRALEVSL